MAYLNEISMMVRQGVCLNALNDELEANRIIKWEIGLLFGKVLFRGRWKF